MTDLSDRIATARASRGASLEATGEVFGITAQAVQQWEKGVTRPDQSRLLRLAEFFGVDPLWLIFGRKPTTNAEKAAQFADQLPQQTFDEWYAVGQILKRKA